MRFGILPRASTATLAQAREAWYDPNWTKRQKVTITSDTAQTNFPVELAIVYDANMNADFSDLRFTKSDKVTLIDFWLESKTDSTSAVVFAEVPVLANGDTIIYMYYGNAAAATASSGANTFTYFNDFDEADNVTPTGWTIWNGSTQCDGASHLENNGGVWGGIRRTAQLDDHPQTARCKCKVSNGNNIIIAFTQNAGSENPDYCIRTYGAGTIKLSKNNGGWSDLDTTAGGFYTADTWAIVELKWDVGALSCKVKNGGNTDTLVSNDNALNFQPYLNFVTSTGSTALQYDWVLVRKYQLNEPSAAYGAEESV